MTTEKGSPCTPSSEGLRDAEFEPEDDLDLCWNCGGDGFILAADGDGDDWGEDTYSGPMDATIKCRHCNGGQR